MDITERNYFLKALKEEGVDKFLFIPEESSSDLFDELYRDNEIDIVLPRHEQALVHEAEGYARETGKTGVCLVTSGPGATNTITAIADTFATVSACCIYRTGSVESYRNDALFSRRLTS